MKIMNDLSRVQWHFESYALLFAESQLGEDFQSDTESDTRAEILEHVGAFQITCKPAVVEGKTAKEQIRSFWNISEYSPFSR
jgi:hypothetical protein